MEFAVLEISFILSFAKLILTFAIHFIFEPLPSVSIVIVLYECAIAWSEPLFELASVGETPSFY